MSDSWWRLGDSAWSRGDAFAVAELLLTALGFGLAIWQLARTALAAEQTAEKLDSMQARFVGNDLLVLLPMLHQLEDQFDTAVKSGTSEDVEKVLVSYSRTCSQVSAMLEAREEDGDEPVMKLLNQASRTAARAKAELANGTDREMRDVVRLITTKMGNLSPEVSALVARLQRKVDDK